MLVAHAKVKGRDIYFVGLTPKQLDKMAEGRPIIVAEESHPGLPNNGAMVMFQGKDDQELLEILEKKDVVEDALSVTATEKVTLPPRSYPEGRLAPDDDGEIQFRAAADHEKGLVVIDFGKPVKWLAFPPDKAMDLCSLIAEKAAEVNPELGATAAIPQFHILTKVAEDDSKAEVRILPPPEAEKDFALWMTACEYFLAVTASKSDAGFEKALELLVQGAMTYKHVGRPPRRKP